MSTLTSYASASARDSAAPAASNTGLCIFRSDTKAIEVSDGTNYQTYNSDGVFSSGSFPTNSYSASFDGTNDYINTNSKFDFIQQTCDFSIVCWVKFTNYTSTSANQAILATNYTGSQKGFYLFYDNRTNNKTLRTIFRAGSNSDISVNNAVSDNDWFHLAVTCAAGGTQRLYVDGSVIGSATAPTTTTTSAYHNMTLGVALVNAVTPSYFFGGNLDEVGIFDRELTSSEIDDIRATPYTYNAFTSLYRLENNANDESGANDGTNNGATFSSSTKPY